MSFLKDILTDASGEAYDVVSVLSVASFALGLVFKTYEVFFHPEHVFDMQAYGIGVGALITSVGLGLRLRDPGAKT